MEHQVGSAVGSYLPGLLHDTTASHTPPLLGSAAALLAAMIGRLLTLHGNSHTADAAQPQPQPLSSNAA
ncbi:hypothetical protein Sgleb_13090 [Streptomyces glebosus]|uniref:Uncharacterized protein n=1 Tax=Streptomyces glebosus TaxID=249580 RepID=A0A640SR04_9ACTN|nr:hypothetical protein [Streptomyces glebosus]GFE13262.1 hypothetical protein Sgleb_13090 [Streptomyces glebosus]GHG66728.1 hypothetical protein GCM10010513_36230 [Streptomyces glebosus]